MKKWKRRIRKKKFLAIGRIYSSHPGDGERFYLRLLLNHVRGATSFIDLRTYKNITYPTFKEACVAHELLKDDQEWDVCLTEAATLQTGKQLRQLFATILYHCEPINVMELWTKHKQNLTEDILFVYQKNLDDFSINFNDACSRKLSKM